MDRDDLLDLLHPQTGLRCLAPFTRFALHSAVEQNALASLETLEERLAFVARHIEPMVDRQPLFRAVCEQADSAQTGIDLAGMWGLPAPEEEQALFPNWLEWAMRIQLQRAHSLFCLANFWTLSSPQLPIEIVAITYNLLGTAFLLLGEQSKGLDLLEGWLGLEGDDYSDPTRLSHKLQDSDFGQIGDAVTRANTLRALANILRLVEGRGPRAALALMEGWLGLEGDDYSDPARLSHKFQDSDFGQIGDAVTRSNTLQSLADILRLVEGRGPRTALALVESYLEVTPERFFESPRLRESFAPNLLGVMQSWLRAAGSEHPRLLRVGEAIIEFILSIRNRHLPTFEHRKEFFNLIRGVRDELLRVALARAISAHAAGDEERAWEAERHLLTWAEVFENRSIAESIKVSATPTPRGGDGADLVAVADIPWPFQHVPRPDSSLMVDRYLPRSNPYTAQCCLEALSAPTSTTNEGVEAPGFVEETKVTERLRDLPALSALIPRGEVWIRTLFDDDGRLHWWALRSRDGALEVLARGQGGENSKRALAFAVIRFDHDIERIWSQYAGSGISMPDWQMLTALASWLENPSEHQAAIRDPANGNKFGTIFAKLADQRRRQLVGLGMYALRQLAEGASEEHLRELGDTLRSSLGSSRSGWKGDATAKEKQRKQELDAATMRYVKAVQQHLDLSALAGVEGIDWSETDVLIQPQGPLWSAPLALLDFGGKPLFRRVASVSSVVSLTLRQIAAEQAEGARMPSKPAMCSAHWLPPEDWDRGMRGLAHLHAGLEVLADRAGWDLVALGDDPVADVPSLLGGLSESKPLLVIVGGHGGTDPAGVNLADELWRGTGYDSSETDLIVLVSCSVGRVRQDGRHDIEGLFANLASHRGRSLIAARWPIADAEAGTFVAELVKEYQSVVRSGETLPAFARARALNRVRCRMLDHEDEDVQISEHLVAAFDLFNYG